MQVALRRSSRAYQKHYPFSLRAHRRQLITQIDPATTGFAASPSITALETPHTDPTGPRKPPNPLWKAYAHALRPFLSADDDLHSKNMALYVASPFSFGIPGGKDIPREIKNQQIANICDKALTLDSPLLSDAGGSASYFETQLNYLSSVETSNSSAFNKAKLVAAREQLKTYQTIALDAYNADQARFAMMKSLEPDINFTDWMKNYGIEYSAAWLDLQTQQEEYKSLLGTSAGPLGAAMDLMLSARSKLAFQAGNNMPCSGQDLGPALGGSDDGTLAEVEKSSVFYRPLYSISGYDRCVDGWISSFDDNAKPSVVLDLDFDQALSSTWQTLGFPNLDNIKVDVAAPPIFLPLQSSSLIQSMPNVETLLESTRSSNQTLSLPDGQELMKPKRKSAATTTKGKSSSKSKTAKGPECILPAPKPVSASVSLYGMQAFDVDRGFWNLDGIWNFKLGSGADDALQKPLLKIVRILTGYKVELQVSFDRLLRPGDAKGAVMGIPLSAGMVHNGSIRYTTNNDAVMIPQVLAVLARRF